MWDPARMSTASSEYRTESRQEAENSAYNDVNPVCSEIVRGEIDTVCIGYQPKLKEQQGVRGYELSQRLYSRAKSL